MNTAISGKAWCFEGLIDVDWHICPAEHMHAFKENLQQTYDQRLAELGQYCMTTLDPEFPRKIERGDIIVGGDGFGYGHDHDHACMSIRGAGIAAVICESSNSNFMRNAIHHGLPVIEVPGIHSGTTTGDRLEVDLAGGIVRNTSSGKIFSFTPYPDFILDMLEAGGLYPKLTEEVRSGQSV